VPLTLLSQKRCITGEKKETRIPGSAEKKGKTVPAGRILAFHQRERARTLCAAEEKKKRGSEPKLLGKSNLGRGRRGGGESICLPTWMAKKGTPWSTAL